MTLNRRTLIKGAAACGGTLTLARTIPHVDVALYDSRFGMPTDFGAIRSIDLVDERRAHWATIRAGLHSARSVTGITTWSDYVLIAHELERRGFRRAAEGQMGRLWRFTLLRQDQGIERNHTLA